MGRPRDPRRDAAKDLFLARRGNITTKELAEKAGVPDSTIRKWKSLDGWQRDLRRRIKALENETADTLHTDKVIEMLTPEGKQDSPQDSQRHQQGQAEKERRPGDLRQGKYQ